MKFRTFGFKLSNLEKQWLCMVVLAGLDLFNQELYILNVYGLKLEVSWISSEVLSCDYPNFN